MAETTGREQAEVAEGAPKLHPGRPADPVAGTEPTLVKPGADTLSAMSPGASEAVAAESGTQPSGSQQSAQQDPPSEGGEVELGPSTRPQQAGQRQKKLRLLLRQCDRVLLLDFNLLAMPDWPDNYTVAAARRRRDIWLFCVVLAGLVFLSGLTGLVPAWLAGSGFGAFVIILLSGVPFIRRLYSSLPSYWELVLLRQRLVRDARRHIAHLEGHAGLLWQCAQMVEFNPALRALRFRRLIDLSEKRWLPRHLTRREHIRLYLIYMLESEKAYNRLQKAFFEGNQQAIDEGWETVAAEPEPRP
ncbi:hypothetical protein [Marinobacter sp. SS21]|uniref:hypothetical protein n=1 Tax=Marinobacter sp. SS21 TaxID=2979460 RepID=UPI0023302096|nr:hypothetical protein [Marinobacter sp. SS21]MDC0662113.1 hypothetical protein [Marinobacter sp. SS21]